MQNKVDVHPVEYVVVFVAAVSPVLAIAWTNKTIAVMCLVAWLLSSIILIIRCEQKNRNFHYRLEAWVMTIQLVGFTWLLRFALNAYTKTGIPALLMVAALLGIGALLMSVGYAKTYSKIFRPLPTQKNPSPPCGAISGPELIS